MTGGYPVFDSASAFLVTNVCATVAYRMLFKRYQAVNVNNKEVPSQTP